MEFHPHYQQSKELHNITRKNGIVLQAYSSLGGTTNLCLLKDPVIKHIAHGNGITPAQVLLRYALQRGYGNFYSYLLSHLMGDVKSIILWFSAIVPKSVTPQRIQENAQLEKELSTEDINTLNNIGRKEKYAWNPETVL